MKLTDFTEEQLRSGKVYLGDHSVKVNSWGQFRMDYGGSYGFTYTDLTSDKWRIKADHMTFAEIIPGLLAGKKYRRSVWPTWVHTLMHRNQLVDNNGQYYVSTSENLQSKDWEENIDN